MCKLLITTILMFTTCVLHASPSPFGLEIGKTTIKEVKEKYQTKQAGINNYSDGEMYDVSGIEFDGLKQTRIIFSQDGKLLAVICTFPKDKFNSLLDNLSEKYRIISKSIPFVGDKYVEFAEDNTLIILNAPHMSFSMEMTYIDKELQQIFEEKVQEQKSQVKKSEKNQL